MKTFFSLTLEPHHQRVLVFPSGGVFRTSIFLLASCAFCFHWSLVSGDHPIIGRLCLWLVSNFLFSTLKLLFVLLVKITWMMPLGHAMFHHENYVYMPDDFCFGHSKHYVAINNKKWLDHSWEFYKHLIRKSTKHPLDWLRMGVKWISAYSVSEFLERCLISVSMWQKFFFFE